VDDAVGAGATVLAGGRVRPDIGPFAFEPTVLTDVTDSMQVCRNETFGPVVSLYRVRDDDEAIARANDTRYGLNASVLTGNLRDGERVGAQLMAGTVNINEGYAAAWSATRAPMGGMKDSGIGRRHGDDGLLKYTEAQTVAVQRVMGFGPPSGWSDRKWGDSLTLAIKTMKNLGVK
jgi:succinate-semialdehyde dehydrogenase/glutarate-semialdehyde dehydrogenase